jgi:hypothetical protein
VIVLACDPGSRQSAILAYDGSSRRGPIRNGVKAPEVVENGLLLGCLRLYDREVVAFPLLVESVEHYGQRVGQDIFDTVRFAGRLQEVWESRGGTVHLVPRRTVKMHLCGTMKANDSDIRQALFHRFGDGTRASAVGVKAAPGPLYGVSSHLLAALAVAVTWHDQNTEDTP